MEKEAMIFDHIRDLKRDLNTVAPSDIDLETVNLLRTLTLAMRSVSEGEDTQSWMRRILPAVDTSLDDSGQLGFLLDVIGDLVKSNSKQEALEITVTHAAKLVNGERASIWLTDRFASDLIEQPVAYRNRIVCVRNPRADGNITEGVSEYKGGEGLTGWVYAAGIPIRLSNISDKNELRQFFLRHVFATQSDNPLPIPRWTNKFGGYTTTSLDEAVPFMAVPIKNARITDDVIGVLKIPTSRNHQPFSTEDEKTLEVFATVLAVVLSNIQRREDVKTLIDGLRDLGTIPNYHELLVRGADIIPTFFDGSHASILMREEDGLYHIQASSAAHLRDGINEQTLKPYAPGEGKTGKAIIEKRGILEIDSAGLESSKLPEQCEAIAPATSFIAAPLLNENGDVNGVLRVPRSSPPAFTSLDLEVLEAYTNHLGNLINIALAAEKM